MVHERNSKKTILEAVVLCLLLLGTGFISAVGSRNNQPTQSNPIKTYYDPNDPNGTFVLDRSYVAKDTNPASLTASDYDDAGYRRDTGNTLATANNLYPGELIDNTEGRGRTGKISSTDFSDWLIFSIAKGQQVHITLTPPSGFNLDLGIYDQNSVLLTSSNNTGSTPEDILYTAPDTMKICMCFRYVSGTSQGQYQFTIDMMNQNDAETGTDASNTIGTALLITPGIYPGYLDMNDPYDYYKFEVTQGQWINLTLTMRTTALLADFDLQLYNPSGILVYEGNRYYDDSLDYPADVSGIWTVRVDIFPGWVDCPHPTDWKYYSYGSGPYSLTLAFKTTGLAPPAPIPEPQIIPIAKTFIIPNQPTSSADEFGYLASIPACNYLQAGQRYLAPIVYSNDNTPTGYFDDPTAFGTVDNTTQYLINDWNTYLSLNGKTADQYTVPADPVAAAADIATKNWNAAQTAVVAVDGHNFNDTTKTVLKRTGTIKHKTTVTTLPGDSPKIKNIGGSSGYPFFVQPKYCAINVSMLGTAANANLGLILPQFLTMAQDWWPSPYDAAGNAIDMYYPVTRPGVWSAGTDHLSNAYTFKITEYEGDRYHVKVSDPDSVINATITTSSPSDLLVFLVDPAGNLRSPDIPVWNGPVNPVHIWNGLENPAYNPWRIWVPAPHTEFSCEVLHPEAGKWTVLVVPRNANGGSVSYTLTTTIRTINQKRANAEMSASNAAVIASMIHAPLLYVTEDSVPTATANAFTTLGVIKVIFVERGDLGSAVRTKLPTIDKDLKTTADIVTEIKSLPGTENYITITSLKTGKGFFAPAAMLAAYHGSPILRIEDMPGNPAAVVDRIETWQLWDGDYYHGSRSTGHLPMASAPIDQNKMKLYISLLKYLLQGTGTLPDYGLDAKRYWNQEMVTAVQSYVKSLNLDLPGQEGYAIVAPRKDICLDLHSALMGNNSYAGHVPGDTPAYTSDVVVRDVLYPALIFANPNRAITTSEMMNFPDGGAWKCNDGKMYKAYSSREVKNAFSSHLRTYDGHCTWVAHLQRMNDGASVFYYSGHGTGGSGISGQYIQTDNCNWPDQIWWDAWRGYADDNWKMPRNNGMIWYNPEPPQLYDLIHYKWVDQLTGNLRSNAIFYMSCTTADGDCPMVYLDHGALCWYGNAGTGLCPEADLGDDNFFNDVLINGVSIGVAFSHQVWLHYRDYTTLDNTSMYGSSSMQVTTIQTIFGDPSLVIFSPEWTSPVPIDASFY
jgi:hypothetical protein